MGIPARTLLGLAASVAMALTGAARAQVDRPEASGRIVRVFDFEEREFNLDPVPMHWIRAHNIPGVRERPGFPNWNRSAFSEEYAHSGKESFMLPTSGGSVSARLVSGVLAAIPGSDYQVEAYVRTRGLNVARARVVARLLDADGNPIEGSEGDTGLLASEEGWERVEARLSGDFDNAAWIQIDLEVLQPAQFPRDRYETAMPFVEPHRVDLEDLSGAAWFDDITVRHIPRLDVASGTPTNLFVAPERPEIRFLLRDLTGDELVGELTLTDESGAVVQRDTISTPAGGGEILWSPEPSGYGWRRAELDIIADGAVLQHGVVSYCWLPPLTDLVDEEGWTGLIAEQTPPDRTALLPEIARRVDARAVTLTVWDEWMRTGNTRSIASEIEPAVDGLLDEDRETTFALRDVPAHGEAASLVGRRLIDLLGKDRLWEIALDPLVARFGQRVHAWRLGANGDRDIVWTPGVAEALAVSLERLRRYAPTPRWILPVDADQKIDDGLRGEHGFSVLIPIAAPNEAIAPLVERWTIGQRPDAEGEEHDLEFVLETHPHEWYGLRAGAVALAQRAILAWSAGAHHLSLAQPWSHSGKAPGQIDPWPELAVWRTMGDHLRGRTFAGELPIAEGVRAMILVDPTGSRCAIAAWNEGADAERAVIRLHLGDGDITEVDCYGNETPVGVSDGLHTVSLTDSPVFIEGVDPGLVLFQAGFRVEPAMIRSSATLHTVEIVMRNPFPTSIAGRFRVVEPEDWKINPRVHRFSIAPGAEQRFPVEVSFGVGEIAGTKPVTLDVELAAVKSYPRITLHTSVEVGLTELVMQPTVLVDKERDRVLVTVQITNLSDRPQSIEVFVAAPGRVRKSATVSKLAPGESTIRRLLFHGDAESMRGETIRIGLSEIDGPGRLNGLVHVN
ncbi:MAG: hypothetical protein H6814_00310 [Phycisphaeraceae bacterium]|nr:hypothetical protein [Phycisphaeraceae bacterium]